MRRRLIGESTRFDLATGSLTKEHLDGQNTCIRTHTRAFNGIARGQRRTGRFALRVDAACRDHRGRPGGRSHRRAGTRLLRAPGGGYQRLPRGSADDRGRCGGLRRAADPDRAVPFRSRLREIIRGRTEELEALAVEMYARGLSTRDIEALFADADGRSLLCAPR
jgi:hypothetical protein